MSMHWFQRYYLIYAIPFAVAVLLLMLSGVSPHGSHGAHAAHGVSGHGVHLHLHAGHAGHAVHGGGVHTQNEPDANAARVMIHARSAAGEKDLHVNLSLGSQLLALFGIGRAPLPVALGSLLIGWGLGGLITTESLDGPGRDPSRFILPALIVALACALVFVRIVCGLLIRYMPQDESFAVARADLVGLTGTVVYPVSDRMGRIHIFDQFRTLHVEPARMRAGRPTAAKGEEVLVVAVNAEKGCLLVDSLIVHHELTAADAPIPAAKA